MSLSIIDWHPSIHFLQGLWTPSLAWNHVAASWRGADKDLRNLGIGGDSAGGYLATMVCQQGVRSGLTVKPDVMPAWQWLIYPVVNCTDRTSEAYGMYSHSLLLTSQLMTRFHDTYVLEREQQSFAGSVTYSGRR